MSMHACVNNHHHRNAIDSTTTTTTGLPPSPSAATLWSRLRILCAVCHTSEGATFVEPSPRPYVDRVVVSSSNSKRSKTTTPSPKRVIASARALAMQRASVSRRSEHISSPPIRSRSSERSSRLSGSLHTSTTTQQQHEEEVEASAMTATKTHHTQEATTYHRRAMSDPFDTQQLDLSMNFEGSEDFKTVATDDVDEFEDAMSNEEEDPMQKLDEVNHQHSARRARAPSQGDILPSLPRYPVEATRNKNCWSEPPISIFQVRGPNYFSDKKKVRSPCYLMPSRGCDVFLSDNSEKAFPLETRSILGGQLRMYPTLAVNFRFPWGYMNLYFEVPSSILPYMKKYDPSTKYDPVVTDSGLSAQERSLAAWFQGNDDYKNDRLKLISYVAEGPWVVRNLVTGRPVIIGRKLPVVYEYSAGEPGGHAPLLTATLDIGGSSNTAKNIVSVCRRYMSSLAVDIGFVIQAETKEELPEQMMGSIRIHNVDPLKAPQLS